MPKHFIVITHGNGWIEPSYTCVARSETDFDLGPSYQALIPFKKDLVVLSKFYNPFNNSLGSDHGNIHGNGWGALAVSPVSTRDTRRPGAQCCGEISRPAAPRSIA